MTEISTDWIVNPAEPYSVYTDKQFGMFCSGRIEGEDQVEEKDRKSVV